MPGQFHFIRTGYITFGGATMAAPDVRIAAGMRSPFLFGVLLLLLLLLLPAPVVADPALMRPGDARSGTLLFKSTEEGAYVRAPLVATDFDITVSGPTARARVTQHFFNPTEGWVEGVYVYPLPDTAAVDSLKVVIGNRVIVGEIKERREAKQIYERAKAEGKKAALMEQERPNIFTNSLANIGPGETVVVQMEYQQAVPYADREFSLRVPLVVAPRYNPAPVVQTVSLEGGWGRSADPVPDRARITPPVLDPAKHGPMNPVTLTVRLQAGFPLGAVKSHHHTVKARTVSDDTQIITVEGAVPADRDFELTWSAKRGNAPTAGLFHERVADEDYLLAFVTPPLLEQAGDRKSREVIFVIDTSGSMGGASILQARASLIHALDRLSPDDRFNIIHFSNTHSRLFPAAVPADVEHLGTARQYVGGLMAGGGTNMVPAMASALNDQNPGEGTRLRQVVFLTDGAIGNERQLFDTITAGLGRSRIFMVGIGSAPNSYLMNHAAALGRGSVTHIGSTAQVEERMRTLFARLEKPAVTDLRLRFSGVGAEVTPEVLPDLYSGETLQIAAKSDALRGNVEISGRIGERPWQVSLPLDKSATGKGISKVWARARIRDAEIGVRLRRIAPPEADARILKLALAHGLVSRLTSLVAVDTTPDRPADAPLTRADVPLNLPAGWEFDKVFGRRGEHDAFHRGQGAPQHQDREAKRSDTAFTKIAFAARPAGMQGAANQTGRGVTLPQTGTRSAGDLRLGLLILAAALVLLVGVRIMGRRRAA